MMDNLIITEDQVLPNLSQQKPSRVRYMVVVLIFMATAINYLDRTNMAVTAPLMQGEFGFDAAILGLLFSGFSWAYALMQIPGGMFLDRFGSRITYAISCSLWSLFTFLMSTGSSFATLLGLRLGIGFSEAPAFPTNSRVGATWFPKQERGKVTAIYLAAQYVGLAFLTPVLFWLQANWGWRSIFYVTGGIGLIYSAIWYYSYRDPKDSKYVNEAELAHIRRGGGLADNTVTGAKIAWSDLAELFKHRQLLGIYLGQFCQNATVIFFLTWFPTYLIAEKHMPMLKVGIYASIPFLAAFVGALFSGWLSDNLLNKGHSLTLSRKFPIISGGLLSACIIAANYTNDFDTIIAIMSIAYFGQGMAGISWVLVGDAAPSRLVGLAGGTFNFCGNLCGAITPIVIGFIVKATGSFTGALLFISCVAVIGVCSYIFIVGDIHRIELASDKIKQ